MSTEVISKKNNKIFLTKEQLELVLESLLYAGSINVGAEWSEDTCRTIIETAIDIKSQIDEDLHLSNLTYFKDECFEDGTTTLLQEGFDIQQFTVKTLESI